MSETPVLSRKCQACGHHVRVKKNGSLYKHRFCDADLDLAAPKAEDESAGCVPAEEQDADLDVAAQAAEDTRVGYVPTFLGDPFTTAAPVSNRANDGTLYGKGPWFGAQFPGECEGCLNRFEEGDPIRADGEGSYECQEWCGQDDDFVDPMGAPGAAVTTVSFPVPDDPRAAGPGRLEIPDAFTLPGTGPITVDEVSRFSATGQLDPVDAFTLPAAAPAPEAEKRNAQGQYQVKDPVTGDYRRRKNGNIHAYTRVTTFVKAASDSKALNDWGKRNVAIGMGKEPQLAVRAAGLQHDTDREALDQIVLEASTLAGAKVAANTGTEIHKVTERLDAGEITLADIENPTYRMVAERYLACLRDHGLVPVRGLIERTTLVREYGGVCGTFDRVYHHLRSDTYLIGDVKSGKTLKYGKNEIEAQLALYVLGFNAWGVYDWGRKLWNPYPAGCACVSHESNETCRGPIQVREDWGVVIHMPVQGPDAFTVSARRADLVNGRRHIERCHDVRTQGGGDMKPLGTVLGGAVEAPSPAPEPVAVATWEDLFAGVTDRERAAGLYDSAVAEGVSGDRLARLVGLAQTALSQG